MALQERIPPVGSPDNIRQWVDLMNTCHALLMGGLRHQVGPDGDVEAAYRAWYEEAMREHDEMIERMLLRFSETDKQLAR